MASISRQPNGHRTIQFKASDGRRRSVRLGKTSQRHAMAVKIKVEQLVASSFTGHAMDDETARWVASLDDVLRDRLAAVGLVQKRGSATLKAFLDEYIEGRVDLKPRTKVIMGNVRRNLVGYFGAQKRLRDISPGDCDEWRLWLLAHERLADNTTRKRCGVARQFFKFALRKKLVSENPCADLPSVMKANTERMYFISRQEAAAVIDACPDAQWRLIFVLGRYGGLRCPSEVLRLRWEDVDWGRGRMTVLSPKTEHHKGKESRQVPIFSELLPFLRDVFEAAEPGTERVITRYPISTPNLRQELMRIIKRAGLTPWPKLWQNLRSTRETELAESYPAHVVCAWIGNSQAVATKHYLQVTDDHFTAASKALPTLTNPVQNPVQHMHAQGRDGVQADNGPTTAPLFYSGLQSPATP